MTQYAQSCAICHGSRMQGATGPALAGANARASSIGDFFGYVTTRMPQGTPGSLTHDQYVDIMAYILQMNGYTASGTPLTYQQAEKSTAPLRAPANP